MINKPGTTTGKPANASTGKPATFQHTGKPGFNPTHAAKGKKK